MCYLLLLVTILGMYQTKMIFDFEKDSNLASWNLVLDGVMGGLSTGDFYLNDEGNAVFEGVVSLENNGGFSSVRYDLPRMEIGDNEFVFLRLKGDGKNYQFRIKNKDQNYYSYITEFSTNGEWQEIKIPLQEMYPSFRGRKLNEPNFNHNHIDEIAILIGNKKNEAFKLLLDKIELN